MPRSKSTHLERAEKVGSGPATSGSSDSSIATSCGSYVTAASVGDALGVTGRTAALPTALPSACAASGDAGYTGVGTDSASLSASPYLQLPRPQRGSELVQLWLLQWQNCTITRGCVLHDMAMRLQMSTWHKPDQALC